MNRGYSLITREFNARMKKHQSSIDGFNKFRGKRSRKADVRKTRDALVLRATVAERRFLSFLENNHIQFEFQKHFDLNKRRTAFVDFYIPNIRTIVEIDGNVHDSEFNQAYDAAREADINKRRNKFSIVRYSNDDVYRGIAQTNFLTYYTGLAKSTSRP